MAFIVKKTINGRDYYYLNENKRVDGKVKTKTLAYLGKTKKEAEKLKKNFLGNMKKKEPKKETEKPTERKAEKIEKEEKINPEIKVGNKIDEINRIASVKGFFFQTANIYGGKAGFYTYGHLGKALKNNWENLWRKYILSLDNNFYEIQSNNILPEEVFKASGHIENFNDPLVGCKKCHFRFRVDQFLEDKGVENAESMTIEEMNSEIVRRNLRCPKCGGELGEAKQFNMMFSVNVGFDNEKSYLSPETAQGAYITFLEEFRATRNKLPLGLAIIDKAYRNEISPRQIFFRLREFSQAELQIFFNPNEIDKHDKWEEVQNKNLKIKFENKKNVEEVSCNTLNKNLNIPKFYLYHAAKVQDFYLNILQIPKDKFRFRELGEKERAFYNKIHFDVEIYLDTLGGFKEVAGVHYRTDHDLAGHAKISGKNLEIFDEKSKKKFIPHILELSFGIDRNIWTLLDISYGIGKDWSMFRFTPRLAPIKAAIFPIVKGDNFKEISLEILNDLKKDWNVVYDESGSIGRRYARNDEIGTPYCITIDEKSPKNHDVTIRDRDTKKQIRVKISELKETLKKLINEEIGFESAGKVI